MVNNDTTDLIIVLLVVALVYYIWPCSVSGVHVYLSDNTCSLDDVLQSIQ